MEYAQHYQHRRPQVPQDYYNHPNKILYNQSILSAQNENTPRSNSLKQFLESWNDEDLTGNINEESSSTQPSQVEKSPTVIKGAIRFKGNQIIIIK